MIVSIFGSAIPIDGSDAYSMAREIGRKIAERGWTVCNGGYGGVMEASARGAAEAGGKTIGVTCEYYRSTANRFISEEIRTKNVTERLLQLITLAEGYIVLPGGTGTLAELAMVWEYINKNVITPRPIVVYRKFWEPVIETIKNALADEGRSDKTGWVHYFGSPGEIIGLLERNA